MDDETTGQGGSREGAGRPAGDRKTQISVQLPPALLTWLDTQPGSRSEVIEDALVRMRGPINSDTPPDSVAARMLYFFGSLDGMDFADGESGEEVINLRSGMRVRAAPGFPDGDFLRISSDGENWVQAYGHKVADLILVQYAEMRATADGAKAYREYEHISKHFTIKTGFGA